MASAFVCIHLLLLSGCGLTDWAHNGLKVGPDYCPPSAVVADVWIEADDKRLSDGWPDDPQWWSTLNDPILDNLIQSAYEQNLSLREAGWRVMQARSIRAIAVGNLFPQVQQGFGDYQRIMNSESLATPVPLRTFDVWAAGLNLAWEVDVWGRYRRSIDSADANLQASIGDYDAILLSLIAEVGSAYTDYRTAEKRLEYARHNIQIQEDSLDLAKKQADGGLTGFAGVSLAQSSLESTRATVPSAEISLRQAGNRLCTLLGIPTQDLAEILGKRDIPTAPVEVAIGIPANLLRRRPDIRAAERTVAAQSEQIGIALADLYPAFTITGDIAVESERFSDLFRSASTAGSISPGFQWNVLNYGRIQNNVQLQEYGLQELIANYQNTVLNANQEVEDALVAFLRTQERVEFLAASVKASEEALRLLMLLYTEGKIDFTPVFVLQGELVNKQDQYAQAQGDVVTSLINVYKALGGGWEARCQGFRVHDSVTIAPVITEEMPQPTPADPAIEQPSRPTKLPEVTGTQDA